MPIICDIETVAIDDVGAFVEPAEAPANYKDAQKIADYIAKAEREQITKAALYPYTARIVCMGWINDQGGERMFAIQNAGEEGATLALFWKDVEDGDARFVHPIVTFNGRAFDLPVLMVRSQLLGVKYPVLNMARFNGPNTDLLEKLTFYGTIPPRSLKWYARRFGLPVDDTVSGADVATLVAEGNWKAVVEHCRSDLRLTQGLAMKLGAIRALAPAVL